MKLLIFMSITLMGLDCVATPKEFIKSVIVKKSRKYGINPSLVYSIAMTESNLNPMALGGLGEVGIFQLRPEFHDVRYGNIQHNVEIAVKYLAYVKRKCLSRYGDAWFICYNTGPYRKNTIKKPKQYAYYINVMKHYKIAGL